MSDPSRTFTDSRLVLQSSIAQGLAILAFVGLLSSGCGGNIEIDFSEDGSGIVTEETVQVSDFDSIEAGGIYEVTVVVDPESDPGISIVTDDNLHDNLDVRVDGTVLKLAIVDGLEPSDGLLVKVVVPSLDHVMADGMARIVVAGETAGGNHALQLTSSGASAIDASDYQASTMILEASGESTQIVWASGKISGSASGASTITIKDAESTMLTTSGLAEIN